MLTDDLSQHIVDCPGHIRSVATNIKMCLLLLEQVIDQRSMFLQALLYVNFLTLFAGKGSDEGKRGPKGFLVVLLMVSIVPMVVREHN